MAEKKAPKAAAQQTATPPSTAVQPYDFSQDAGSGLENVRSDDLSIPFLVILQDGSPEVKKTHPEYATKGIKGATAGMIMNTLTKQILNPNIEEDVVEFIPCFYQKLWVEWKDRSKGTGGIVKSHANDLLLRNTKKNDKGQDVLPNGNILNTTAYFFGQVIVGDEPQRCVIGLTSTQLKKARQWLSLVTSIKFDGPSGKFTPPLFAHRWGLSTVPENNDKGSWYGWKMEILGRTEDQLLITESREIAHQSKESALRLAPPSDDNGADAEIPGQ